MNISCSLLQFPQVLRSHLHIALALSREVTMTSTVCVFSALSHSFSPFVFPHSPHNPCFSCHPSSSRHRDQTPMFTNRRETPPHQLLPRNNTTTCSVCTDGAGGLGGIKCCTPGISCALNTNSRRATRKGLGAAWSPHQALPSLPAQLTQTCRERNSVWAFMAYYASNTKTKGCLHELNSNFWNLNCMRSCTVWHDFVVVARNMACSPLSNVG